MNFPRRSGIFEKMITGANTVLGIANFVKSWQGQNALQENRQLEGIASRVGLGQKIAEMTGQPVSMEGMAPVLEKAKVPWPKVTPEAQAGLQDTAIRGAGGPTEGFERIGQEKGRGIAEQVAAGAPVGGLVPITPQATKVGILGRGGTFKTVTAPPGTKKIMTEPAPATSYGLYDEATKQLIPTGSTRPTVIKKQKTAEDMEAEAAAKARGRASGTPEVQELDPETGLPVRSFKRKPFFSKKDTSQVPILTEDQAEKIALEGGKVPKGAKILKKGDTEYKIYNQSRNEATRRILGDTKLGMKAGPEQEKAINEMADTIYRTRSSQRGGKKGASGEGQQYQLPKGGQMVPVDKATYDTYWKAHGGKR